MRQTNWDGKEVLLVEVGLTTKVNLFEGLVSERSTRYCYWFQEQSEGVWLSPVKLPDGDWQFAFASPLSPTEEEAGEWVGYREGLPYTDFETKKGTPIYYDYEYPLYIPPDWDTIVGYGLKFSTSVESLHSRIKSEGFPHPERVVLLTKK